MSASAPARAPRSGAILRASCRAPGGRRECRILSLDSRGAFIESFVPPVTGSIVELQFQLPNGHLIRAAGLVKYHQFKVGFGVEFTELSDSDREQILKLAGH
jgi:hypothetical protein